MDNPDDATTIINVKTVRVGAWERAKKAALKNNETMGSWLSRACDQLANLETGERLIPPANPVANPVDNPGVNLHANPRALPVVDFREIAAILEAMHSVGLPVQKRVGQHVNAILTLQLRLLRGIGPGKGRGPLRISDGLTQTENGKADSQSIDA